MDVPGAWPEPNRPHSVLQILSRGPVCLDKVREIAASATEVHPLDSVKLLAPLPRPGKLLALAGNYAEHIKEASQQRGFELGLSDSPPPDDDPPTVLDAFDRGQWTG